MPKLFGITYSKNELLQLVGNISQVGGVKLYTLDEGFQRGVRVAEFKTGTGLNFCTSIDRGMDISTAEFMGMPLAFRSPNGEVHPSFYNEHGLGWIRSFPGGLLTTCGLTYLGSPCIDQGKELGLHGRYSNIPASEVSSGGFWDKNNNYFMFLEGLMREAEIFNENVSLRRRIECKLGEPKIFINDLISNDGFCRTPFMILYHINLGFPVVDENSILITPSKQIVPRDEEAMIGLKESNIFSSPVKDYKEQVFFHELEPDENGYVTVKIINKKLLNGFGVYVKYKLSDLPKYIEWKMMGMGTYVVGIEPANCLVLGRAKERENNSLQFLEPGETKSISLEIGILDNIG